jgi:formylglycine-generating enzyme required for sulfatase activity
VFLFLAVLGTGGVVWWFYPDWVNTRLAEIKQIIAKSPLQSKSEDTPRPPPGPIPGPTPPLPLSVQQKLDEILNRLNKLEQQLVKKYPTNPSDNQIKELKEQLKQISDFLKRVGNTTDDITAKVSDLYDKLETSSPDVQTLHQTMTNVLQEMVKLEVDKLRAKLAQLQASVEEYHTEIAKVNQKLAEGNLQATEIATMVADLQVNNTKWEATLKEIKRIKETLPAKTELAEFQQRVESLGPKIENMELQLTIQAMIQKTQNAEVKQQLEALARVAKPKVVIIDDLRKLFGLPTAVPTTCLTSLPPGFQRMLPMSLVNVQEQPVPDSLKEWMKDMKDSQVSESPFYIMRREVTIAEFRRYVNQLSSPQQEDLGNKWQEDNSGNPLPESRPVASVPWWAANGYAEWLSQQTRCDLALPTRQQWAAAAIQYANSKNAIVRQEPNNFSVSPQSRNDDNSEAVDLLGNLREWSIEKCSEDGYYLLGEDYKTNREQIRGEPSCQIGRLRLDTNGFRLILKAGTEPNPPSQRVPSTSI